MPIEATQEEVDAARGYEELFVPALFAPWTSHVIEAANIRKGSYVVDVACGTGALTRIAADCVGEGGRVVGVDLAPGMLKVANEIAPRVDWEQGNATALSMKTATVDTVLSQFGLMFFQDLQLALDEFFRVLRSSGTVVVAVWNDIARNPAYEKVSQLLDEHVSAKAGDALRMPYRLGDAETVVKHLSSAGFESIEVATLEETGRFPSAGTMVEAELRGWLPLFDIHLDDEHVGKVLGVAERYLSDYARQGGGVAFPTSAHVISAFKP